MKEELCKVGARVVYQIGPEGNSGLILRRFVLEDDPEETLLEVWPHDTDPDTDDSNWPDYVPLACVFDEDTEVLDVDEPLDTVPSEALGDPVEFAFWKRDVVILVNALRVYGRSGVDTPTRRQIDRLGSWLRDRGKLYFED